MLKFVKRAVGPALLATAAAIVMAANANATGALAVGATQETLAYGWSADYPLEGDAKYEALANCITEKATGPEVRANCRLVTVFNKQCFGLAWDVDSPTFRWGWALNASKKAAETAAIANCSTKPGSNGTTSCVVGFSECDSVGVPPIKAPAPSPEVSTFTPEAGKVRAGSGNITKAKH